MGSETQPKVLAPWKIRMFGLSLVAFGSLFAAFSWASLKRPDIKTECQYEYTADPACKRAGIWGGLCLGALGLPFLLAPRKWLLPKGGRGTGGKP